MEIVEFEDGTKMQDAYVEVDGVKHEIVPARYTGNTPLNAYNLNRAQNNLLTNKYSLSIATATEAGVIVTLPCYYKVGQGVLDVFLNGERLLLSSDDVGTDGHYQEVGDADSISNQIKITTDWSLESGDYFDIVVRGEWSK